MKKSIFGMLITMEGLFLVGVLCFSLYYRHTCGDQDWQAFAITSGVTLLSGMLLCLLGRKKEGERRVLTKGDSFIIVGLTWIIFSLFGMLPFLLYSSLDIDVAGAYFETMSGFTTTGATVLSNIDSLPHGLLLWRSLMQWMGGLGIVVFSFALIPSVEMKNANMYQAEVTGISLDRLKPKIGATARRMLLIYLFFTFSCALMYWLGPMGLFDALNHAMTTIATGGYSTHTASMGYFHSAYIEYVAAFFMIVSSINFSLYYYASIRKGSVLARNDELQTFLMTIIGAVALFCLLFAYAPIHHHSPEALLPDRGMNVFRVALFHVATTISSSGFQGEYFDYVGWGASFWMPTVVIMAIGSCAGSTAGGIKIVRVIIYAKCVVNEFLLHLHPRAVLSVRLNGKVVPVAHVRRALAYIIMYTMLAIVGIVVFTLMGIDVDSAIGACISSLSNVGPGTGQFGPASTFAAMPSLGKWLLSFYMVVGRLEIFTILFLFMPKAWKQ